ncbi:allantoinase AllB [Paenibacillus hunanensis]|uniref:allantoinase AllB n=1 Tax=Paenibacillus hunanensis TaxID=539262 RepID=UPI0020264071|nr:allantoinase AllB [Paenibacillus hunanensis]MCL9663372.1 allantoinase AllB [Paenibacillus hunanensis]
MTHRLDVIIQGGTVVLPDRVEVLDIGIQDGKIVQLAPSLQGQQALRTIDANGLYVLPGAVDIHVHFNEPGLASWEGFTTGSAALAAGGITTYVDMPLNGVPPTTSKERLELKQQAANGNSYVDYALWGGLVEGNVDQLQGLVEGGVPGFKAFMSEPGGDGEDIFTRADQATLREGMKELARLGYVLALHAEDEEMVAALAAEAQAAGNIRELDYAHSRPIEAEVRAVRNALQLGQETGCALHFVHISSREAVDVIIAAKAAGQNVTVETCPHYLVLTEQDLLQKGVVAKCAPPLRSEAEQEQLWQAVQMGLIDIVASDHSPCPPELKQTDNFFKAWGGIAGAQSTLLLMLEEGYHRRSLTLPALMTMLAQRPAERLGLAHCKGLIAEGMDADLVLVDLSRGKTLQRSDLLDKHRQSPYIGYTFSSTIVETIIRGSTVYSEQQGLATERIGQGVAYKSGGVTYG